MPNVRVRFAPSPTGYLHVGGLRTALYNYLFARQHGGVFVLRIEDTDQERFVDGAESDILESLRWAGLDADEGPTTDGPFSPYHQSRRRDHYTAAARQLLDAGRAYYAFDTPEELEALRERRAAHSDAPARYDVETRSTMVNSLTLPESEVRSRIEAGVPHVVRLKVEPGETIAFEDVIRGLVSFDTGTIDDQVLVKSDGLPTYHLANVVDDHLMEISHVIRGEEWLPSTPKHLLLYRYLGWEAPQMAHLPLILSPTGGKLSKRSADRLGIPISVRDYRAAGYEPGALLNYLAFLGWNPGTEEELFSLDELVQAFSLERVGSAGVQFNVDKLNWYNQQYVKRLDPAELAARAMPQLETAGFAPDPAYLEEVARLMQERLVFGAELADAARYFFEDPPEYEAKGIEKRWKEDSAELVNAYADRLEATESVDPEAAEQALRALAEDRSVGAGRIIHAVRLAVSGVTFGPGLFDMIALIGREAVVRRLRRAAEALG